MAWLFDLRNTLACSSLYTFMTIKGCGTSVCKQTNKGTVWYRIKNDSCNCLSSMKTGAKCKHVKMLHDEPVSDDGAYAIDVIEEIELLSRVFVLKSLPSYHSIESKEEIYVLGVIVSGGAVSKLAYFRKVDPSRGFLTTVTFV